MEMSENCYECSNSEFKDEGDKMKDEESVISGSITDDEKLTLRNLNDRLANYVDTVRKWGDPKILSINSATTECLDSSVLSTHIETIRDEYEQELRDCNTIIEKEFIEKSSLIDKLEKVENKNSENIAKLADLSKKLQELELKYEDLEDDYAFRMDEIRTYQRDLEVLKLENAENQKVITDLKAKLDEKDQLLESQATSYDQILVKYTTVLNTLAFKEDLHKKEIESAYQTVNEIKTSIQNSSKDQDSYTIDELMDLRMEIEGELENAKQNVLAGFRERLTQVENDLLKADKEIARLNIDKEFVNQKCAKLETDLESYKSRNSILEAQLTKVENERSSQVWNLQKMLLDSQSKLSEATEKLHGLMYDYEQVVGNHLTLDTEISAYRKLIDSEERRLCISPRKRFRSASSKESFIFSCLSGSKIKFDSCDLISGYYIKVVNATKKPIVLNNYRIKLRTLSTGVVKEFKIPKIALPSAEYLTIYSSSYTGEVGKLSVTCPDIYSWVVYNDENYLSIMDAKENILSDANIKYLPPYSDDTATLSKRHRSNVTKSHRTMIGASPLARKRHSFSNTTSVENDDAKLQFQKNRCTIC